MGRRRTRIYRGVCKHGLCADQGNEYIVMTIQYSTEARNTRLNALETAIGASPLLYIYDLSGTPSNKLRIVYYRNHACINDATSRLDERSIGAGRWLAPERGVIRMELNVAGTADYFRIYRQHGGDLPCSGDCGYKRGDEAG